VVEAGEAFPRSNEIILLRQADAVSSRVGLAENWRRRGKFEEIKFIFPNAPSIPITVVCVELYNYWTVLDTC
jgi:hypothetical protein